MKSNAIYTYQFLPTAAFPNYVPAYHSLPAPMLTANPFLDPRLYSMLSSFPDTMLSTISMSNMQSPFHSEVVPHFHLPHLLETSVECHSQLTENSQTNTDSARSTPGSSLPEASSPPEISNTRSRIRRGRPQQDICDDDDPNSQKRRHRRLYARQYRAQMRHKVDEVKVLKAKLEEARRTVERLEAALDIERREHQQKTLLLNSMVQSKLML